MFPTFSRKHQIIKKSVKICWKKSFSVILVVIYTFYKSVTDNKNFGENQFDKVIFGIFTSYLRFFTKQTNKKFFAIIDSNGLLL